MLAFHQLHPQLNAHSAQCATTHLHTLKIETGDDKDDTGNTKYMTDNGEPVPCLLACLLAPCALSLDILPLTTIFSGLSADGTMLGLSISGLQFVHNNTVFVNLLDFGVDPAVFALGVVLQQTTTGFNVMVIQQPVNSFNVEQLLEEGFGNPQPAGQVATAPIPLQATATISNEEMAALTVWPGSSPGFRYSLFRRMIALLLICIGCGCCGK
ncbi:MAG: hypothetical protein ACR2PT_02910 [Endozoicomonas sp.]